MTKLTNALREALITRIYGKYNRELNLKVADLYGYKMTPMSHDEVRDDLRLNQFQGVELPFIKPDNLYFRLSCSNPFLIRAVSGRYETDTINVTEAERVVTKMNIGNQIEYRNAFTKPVSEQITAAHVKLTEKAFCFNDQNYYLTMIPAACGDEQPQIDSPMGLSSMAMSQWTHYLLVFSPEPVDMGETMLVYRLESNSRLDSLNVPSARVRAGVYTAKTGCGISYLSTIGAKHPTLYEDSGESDTKFTFISWSQNLVKESIYKPLFAFESPEQMYDWFNNKQTWENGHLVDYSVRVYSVPKCLVARYRKQVCFLPVNFIMEDYYRMNQFLAQHEWSEK
ncbi:hypothetical protein EniLVp02_0232 [Vibrio phage EniLVp02]